MNIHTAADVARILGKSERWVRRQANNGRLGCFRAGKSPRFTDEHLAAYICQQQPPAPPQPVTGLVSRRRRAS